MNTVFFITQWQLGDCIGSTAGIDYFKFMGYRTVCFFNPSWLSLFQKSPKIDEVHPYNEIEQVIREQYSSGDVVSFCSYEWSVKLEPKLADINPKYVCPKFQINGKSICTHDEFRTIREIRESGNHITIVQISLWRLGLGINCDYKPCIGFDSLIDLDYKPIVIHTGSVHKVRRIEDSLVKEIVDNLGDNVVVICNNMFVDELKKNGINAIESNVLEMASYLKEAKVVITADSGPMHIRAYFQKPMIGIDTTFESTGISMIDYTSPYDGLEVLRGQDINCSRIIESVKKLTAL